MRTTINVDDELIEEAQRLTGIKERTAVIHEGLKALIAREDFALVPVPLSVGRRETAGDELVPPERREHERRLDPQEQLRIARSVATSILRGALHAHVPRIDPP